MSTIVAVQKGDQTAIAWDSMTGHGSLRCVNKVSPRKVIPVGSSYVGVSGLTAYGNVFEHFLHEKKPPALDSSRTVFGLVLCGFLEGAARRLSHGQRPVGQ